MASGGPTPEGVVLWTRLDPDAFAAGDGRLGVEVAGDGAFERVVHRGVIEDAGAVAAHDEPQRRRGGRDHPPAPAVAREQFHRSRRGGRTRPARPPDRGVLSRFVEAQNPHIDYFDSHRWGYSTVEFTPEDCTWTAYDVEKSVDTVDGDRPGDTVAPGAVPRPDAEREVLRPYRVPEGAVTLEDVTAQVRATHRRERDAEG